MSGWPWLLGALGAAVVSYLVGWPAWIGYRARTDAERNAERYLAWRGRADRRPVAIGLNRLERARIAGAIGLLAVAIGCLAVFMSAG